MKSGIVLFLTVCFFTQTILSQSNPFPRNYFRHPLNIPMQLVANFGEIRTNHWHMGLDIRTQQKVNVPVYASAEGYVSRVSVEPGGFGQAIYITHPNGFTTLYAHLNAFFPQLSAYVKEQQYAQQSWRINLILPPALFPVKKSTYIALSGSTGASEGPHVHFEIRDNETENCLNPLLFGFPIADGVPPTITRLAMYDRNKSTYDQSPQILSLKKSGSYYSVPKTIIVGSDKIRFAIAAVDRFSATPNPNGIYSARILMDNEPVSGFELKDISYNDTRYINAQLDLPFKSRGGAALQHISPLPGARDVAYQLYNEDGLIHLNDEELHAISIEVKDANQNTSIIRFSVQYNKELSKEYQQPNAERFFPEHVNIFERDFFELITTEKTIYDTVSVNLTQNENYASGSLSPAFDFLNSSIPSHDSITVRIKPNITVTGESMNRIIIKNVSGTRTFIQKAKWQREWVSAKFRQFGSFQVFVDNEPPTVNAPPTNLSKASRIVFTPRGNFNVIKNFRVELNGQWLRFTNDKGKSWIYSFDEKFPRGTHELKVTVEDEAGNITVRTWTVMR